MKTKCYTALKIILYCFLAVSIIICVRALIVSGVAASAENDATPALTVMVALYTLLVYIPLPVALVDMLYCLRYFASDKKTVAKTAANYFFILISLGMTLRTVLIAFGQYTTPTLSATLFIYLALRLFYASCARHHKNGAEA